MGTITARPVEIIAGAAALTGDLRIPLHARGLVIFAHGSGSSRFSTRNRHVAEFLDGQGFATLLLDLLTPQEESIDMRTRQYRFDVERLGPRVSAAADWARRRRNLVISRSAVSVPVQAQPPR